MPFTNTQAESLIAQINAISLQNEEEAVKILSTIIAKLKATNTLSEKKEASKKEPNIASQLAVECVQEHFNARLQQIPSTPKTQPLLELIELLFNIHTAEDINAVNAEGRTLLELALATSDLDTLRMLVERYHADVNAVQDDDGNTLLHIKLKQGDYPTARALIEVCGAAVNVRNNGGKTPLHIVAEQGNLQMAQLLVERGADVNSTEGREENPTLDLFATIFFPDLNLKKDAEGHTPLSFAVAGRHMDIAKLLVARKANVNGGGSVNFPLRYAVRNGDLDGFKFLAAQQGADVYGNAKCLVAEAAENGHLELLKYLKQEYGIDITTALDLAAKAGHLKIVEFLEECGAEFSIHDIHLVERILVEASSRGDLPAIKFWLQRLQPRPMEWAPVPNKFDVTALHAAAAGGHVATIEFWLKRGLAINHEDFINWTNRSGNTLLSGRRLWPSEGLNLHDAAAAGDLKHLQFWLNRKVDINAQDNWGRSLLCLAAGNNHVELVRFLLKQGATADIKNWQQGSNSRAKREIANLLEDFSVSYEAAEQIYEAMCDFYSALLPGFVPAVLRLIIGSYIGSNLLGETKKAEPEGKFAAQPPIKRELVKLALRILAKEINNPLLAKTKEVGLLKLEVIKRKIVGTVKDPKTKAECACYWKQLKSKVRLICRDSPVEYGSALEAELNKAFEEILSLNETYALLPVSLSAQPITGVGKLEKKEREAKHADADKMEDEVPVTASTLWQQTFTSSSSSLGVPQQQMGGGGMPAEEKQDSAGFSDRDMDAAMAESLKTAQQSNDDMSDDKSASRSKKWGPKRNREDDKERETEQRINTIGVSPLSPTRSAASHFSQAGQTAEGSQGKKAKKVNGSESASQSADVRRSGRKK